eukprot:scaffold82639_cov58-Phaeocystis_antarctica.AAC.1
MNLVTKPARRHSGPKLGGGALLSTRRTRFHPCAAACPNPNPNPDPNPNPNQGLALDMLPLRTGRSVRGRPRLVSSVRPVTLPSGSGSRLQSRPCEREPPSYAYRSRIEAWPCTEVTAAAEISLRSRLLRDDRREQLRALRQALGQVAACLAAALDRRPRPDVPRAGEQAHGVAQQWCGSGDAGGNHHSPVDSELRRQESASACHFYDAPLASFSARSRGRPEPRLPGPRWPALQALFSTMGAT